MEKLDFVFSKGKLSMSYEGVAPVMIEERAIRLTNARHPLLEKNICVPLQFTIGNGTRGIVITGPNTGGKTVAIKTVALCCMMAQCGLHVPCEKAEICMCSNFLCDIGDGQNLSENLSTFSAHITNVLEILKRVNAKMTFDDKSLKPLYQMVIGQAGESCALQIAKRLGMPADMLHNAMQAAYGTKNEWQGKRSAGNRELPDLLTGVPETLQKVSSAHIKKHKTPKMEKEIPFHRGDSVMVYPDKKIGIICEEANDKGVLRVQLPGKKIFISYKRVKRLVAAEKLYPDDYDFSIIFDSVETRKLRHKMERKYVEGETLHCEE